MRKSKVSIQGGCLVITRDDGHELSLSGRRNLLVQFDVVSNTVKTYGDGVTTEEFLAAVALFLKDEVTG